MAISVFEIFKIGIGPSSSHTVGPMRAARRFLLELEKAGLLDQTQQVTVDLYGSLAFTGKGHCTDRAILLGLEGETPDTVDPDRIDETVERIQKRSRIFLLGRHEVVFDESRNLRFNLGQTLPAHSNGMRFTAFDHDDGELALREYYSIGGGFVVRADEIESAQTQDQATSVPYPFDTASDLLELADKHTLRVDALMLENEKVARTETEVKNGLEEIWAVMQQCVQRGLEIDGVLPGGLNVTRRAPKLYRDLLAENDNDVMDWVNVFALAVNEENAAGGRVVTEPTNGAAGIIPAVLHYYHKFIDAADIDGVLSFLLTAGAIGILYKKNASISGAEMGCQGEVGVACSMAAAGLTAALGGSNGQVENAAEIGMEHNLGLTCDPIKGLVQIPCIERNAMGAVKAINASRMAMRGDGTHKVSLDQVIATMRQTGHDMSTIYKETSQGGLAVNVIEC